MSNEKKSNFTTVLQKPNVILVGAIVGNVVLAAMLFNILNIPPNMYWKIILSLMQIVFPGWYGL